MALSEKYGTSNSIGLSSFSSMTWPLNPGYSLQLEGCATCPTAAKRSWDGIATSWARPGAVSMPRKWSRWIPWRWKFSGWKFRWRVFPGTRQKAYAGLFKGGHGLDNHIVSAIYHIVGRYNYSPEMEVSWNRGYPCLSSILCSDFPL